MPNGTRTVLTRTNRRVCLSDRIRSGSWPAATIVMCSLSASSPKRRRPTTNAKRDADSPNPDEPTRLPFRSDPLGLLAGGDDRDVFLVGIEPQTSQTDDQCQTGRGQS